MFGQYIYNLLVSIDQLGSAFLGGDPDETISSRAAKAKQDGQTWGCVLCKMLDLVDPGHCDWALEPNEGDDATWRFHDGQT